MTLDTRELEDRITELEDESELLQEDGSELDDADQSELDELLSMRDEISEWAHGETLIPENEFTSYARDLADEIGAIPDDAGWPLMCIDWEQAAEQLQQDYTSVEYKGTTYYVRSS